MAYQVLYRKYRPQTLDQVCGQDHIVRSLRNSIATGRIANAYLFTGIHGTGKTTISRVLASMLNCEKGPTDKPCGTCEYCKKIHSGRSPDVIEIDAASNRGIDDVRALREKARYAPSESRCKFFIVDEAHALTSEASNALLKILEEPPPNLHFCLCTTEPRAIIGTIKSRCQHFSVRTVPQKKLFEYLVTIINSENIKINKEALKTVVKTSRGSVRNALRSLESAWNFCGTELITDKAVSEVLGVADAAKAFELVDCAVKRNVVEGMKIINNMAAEGIDISSFIIDLAEHFRNLLVISSCSDKSLIDASDEDLARLEEQARTISIFRMMKTFNELEIACRGNNLNMQPQHVLEVCFLRMIIAFHEGEAKT